MKGGPGLAECHPCCALPRHPGSACSAVGHAVLAGAAAATRLCACLAAPHPPPVRCPSLPNSYPTMDNLNGELHPMEWVTKVKVRRWGQQCSSRAFGATCFLAPALLNAASPV